ncbi:hypothetical protein P171DRAFT_432537 [Karstenula rhodostoma CBS 690.94]|uniref:Uncharacterized protein n=1 Tax=Karstenula rhodostoma CBS 690.94 TaxID=1392251 RepID=A0A9P4UAH8_9PLEO|nr:hypothetical protein P171DRAFT_432537 [Karstenula rhodostoma CBS 690.94]
MMDYPRWEACFELAAVLLLPLLVLPRCTARDFRAQYNDEVPVDVALDELRWNNWQWSWISLFPFLILWTAWQYTRSYDGALVAAFIRSAWLTRSQPPAASTEDASRTPEEKDGAPAQSPKPTAVASVVESSEPRPDEKDQVARLAQALARRTSALEAEKQAHADTSKKLEDGLKEHSSFKRHAFQVVCWPRAVHVILCVTDHGRSTGTASALAKDVGGWMLPEDEERLDQARGKPWYVGKVPLKDADEWVGRMLNARSHLALDESRGWLALLLKPAADNVLQHNTTFITADGLPGSGKTTTLSHAASYIGAYMLKDSRTESLLIYVSRFSPSGTEGELPTMSADDMSSSGVEYVQGSSRWSFTCVGKKRTLAHYVVASDEGLSAVLQHVNRVQRGPATSAERQDEFADGHVHMVIARFEVADDADRGGHAADGALVMVDVCGSDRPSVNADDPSRRAINAYLQGRERKDDQVHSGNQITDVVRAHNCTCKILLAHVNVNHSDGDNQRTLEHARRLSNT